MHIFTRINVSICAYASTHTCMCVHPCVFPNLCVYVGQRLMSGVFFSLSHLIEKF